ncbi:MAG: ABC transporter substrate-binding protein [Actinomycetota bacterium]
MTSTFFEQPHLWNHEDSEILNDLTRREFIVGLSAAGLLAACCRETGSKGSAPGTPSDRADATSGSDSASSQVARVVSLGQGADSDALIALGVTPVAISKGFNDTGIYPWTAAALGEGRPDLLSIDDGPPLEQSATARPDLIMATTYYDLVDNQEKLSQIATIVGPATTADRETWQLSPVRAGQAIGKGDEAQELVTAIEDRIAGVKASHPHWEGRTFTFGPVSDASNEQYTVNRPGEASAVIFEELGLVLAPSVLALPQSATPGRGLFSLERLDVLDADVMMLVFFGDEPRKVFTANPLFQQLSAVRRGAFIDLDREIALGLAFPSVLSLPFALDRIVPLLEEALPENP